MNGRIVGWLDEYISTNEKDKQIDRQIYTLEILLEKRRINEFSKKLNAALAGKLNTKEAPK